MPTKVKKSSLSHHCCHYVWTVIATSRMTLPIALFVPLCFFPSFYFHATAHKDLPDVVGHIATLP